MILLADRILCSTSRQARGEDVADGHDVHQPHRLHSHQQVEVGTADAALPDKPDANPRVGRRGLGPGPARQSGGDYPGSGYGGGMSEEITTARVDRAGHVYRDLSRVAHNPCRPV